MRRMRWSLLAGGTQRGAGMTQPNDGGPAFPVQQRYTVTHECEGLEWDEEEELRGPGMSLRDYFAAEAMHAIYRRASNETKRSEVAGAAFQMADAMLAARAKEAGDGQ